MTKVHKKSFHLGDILSVITRKMKGILDILEFMTNDNITHHTAPRFGAVCEPYLFEKLPFLKQIDVDTCESEDWAEWLNKQIAEYGEYHFIEPIPEMGHKRKSAFVEFYELIVNKEKQKNSIKEKDENG